MRGTGESWRGRSEGVASGSALTGSGGLPAALGGGYDGVVLDVMLPGLDGVGVCTALREQGSAVPVLMLTALGAVRDRVAGLGAGADDHLPKPFSFDELLACLGALQRRSADAVTSVLRAGDLLLDPARRRATVLVAPNRLRDGGAPGRLLRFAACPTASERPSSNPRLAARPEQPPKEQAMPRSDSSSTARDILYKEAAMS